MSKYTIVSFMSFKESNMDGCGFSFIGSLEGTSSEKKWETRLQKQSVVDHSFGSLKLILFGKSF